MILVSTICFLQGEIKTSVMNEFSTSTVSILKKAGWYEGRAIDIQPQILLLKDAGYPIFDKVEAFLTTFGDLDLNFEDVFGTNMYISFDIRWSLSKAGLYERDLIVEDYPRAIGCKMLTLIGRQHTATCLVINEEGIIYTLYDGYILEAGKGSVALDNLITKSYKDLKQVPMPDWWGE